VEVIDPESGVIVPLFNPRQDAWKDHFAWDDYHVVGLTPKGRAATVALTFNEGRKIKIRQAEQTFGLFPPEDS
jgi:hypothetical protein